MLRKIDPQLFVNVARRMMNALVLRGVGEARGLLHRYGEAVLSDAANGESNQPQQKAPVERLREVCDETFRVASTHLSDEEILGLIQRWVEEDKSRFLTRAVSSIHPPLDDLADAIERYLNLVPEGTVLSPAAEIGVRVELIRRMLGEQLDFINIAKQYLSVEDFAGLLRRVVCTASSHGRLGGKASGLILASRILDRARSRCPEIGEVSTPRAWYVTSDAILTFINANDLDELYEQKYKSIKEVRQDYPHIVQVFKHSHFPTEIVKGLTMALDDLGDVPLVVRSSSLLEDRLGHPFAGKYKSLFVANRGSREQRLAALLDAVAEVYASVFGPDPIEYRAERGLLDFREEMGVLIQEVVGRRVGRFWFPAVAGVAFSHNEMRWSPRIRREDGVLRLVPGLGTRAVDRLSDDYPALISPGQPGLRVNVTPDEVVRYSPQKVDLINLESGTFETRDLREVLTEVGIAYPALEQMVSRYRDGVITRAIGLGAGQPLPVDELVVTFEGLVERTPFVARMRTILHELQAALHAPVDVEFAFDGERLFLLQCRPQARARDDEAVQIPSNVTEGDILFSARRYVSNGRVPDLTHLVYVDPLRYAELGSHEELRRVGEVVGRLNTILPRRRFGLMGPGRWGSRGDIKLGVRVTYADISNTALLVEVARRRGSYLPDVSFGTHFFQDLVDSEIRYLPLYPDDPGVRFNEEFLLGMPNLLPALLPEYAHLERTVRVIDIGDSAGGRVLKVVMDGDRDAALGYLAPAG
jgi:hypothetical protein